MIDTDKYEEHTEGPWWINHKDGDGATSIWSGTIDEGDMNHVADVDAHDSDLRLIADAPLLLAEVERLRDALRIARDSLVWSDEDFIVDEAFAEQIESVRDNIAQVLED